MTKPNAQGWMASVWQDSNRAHLYITNPTLYPQYADYENSPEIYISLSPDYGNTWLEPIVLNDVETPELLGMTPTWVYPADQIQIVSHADSTATGRLYLMFFDDIAWGAEVVTIPITFQGGFVKYMAIDFELPYNTSNSDPNTISSLVALAVNYPNPFTNYTEIKYSLNKASKVNISIYNTKGQLVRTLVNSKVKAGSQSISWNCKDEYGRQVSSGLYLYKLNTNGKTVSRKMLMLK
jgi:hypothetical protein